ncbi:MAG: PAS domain S-box protein, partial [Planctomycetes bacterium]|nr:PAS domain S-box protein [Planctomycetota bacterium]
LTALLLDSRAQWISLLLSIGLVLSLGWPRAYLHPGTDFAYRAITASVFFAVIVLLLRFFAGQFQLALTRSRAYAVELSQQIAERRRAEEALKTAKDFAENIVETANTLIITLDSEAGITTFNSYAEQLTGYTKAEVIGKNWFDLFIPPRDKESIPQVFKQALKNMPEVSQYENSIVLKSGKERLISWSNNILRASFGNINGVLSIGMDITERRRAEELLRASSELNENIVNSSPIGISIYNSTGNCIAANEAIGNMVGASKEQVLQQNYHHIESWKKSGLYAVALSTMQEKEKKHHEIDIKTSFGKVGNFDC